MVPTFGSECVPTFVPQLHRGFGSRRSPAFAPIMSTEMGKCDARAADFRCCETSARPPGKMRFVFVFIRKSKMPTRYRGVRRRVSTEVRGRPSTESGGRALNETRDRPHNKKGDAPWTKNGDEPATEKLNHEMGEGEVGERMKVVQGSCEGMRCGRVGYEGPDWLVFLVVFLRVVQFLLFPFVCSVSLVPVSVPSGGSPVRAEVRAAAWLPSRNYSKTQKKKREAPRSGALGSPRSCEKKKFRSGNSGKIVNGRFFDRFESHRGQKHTKSTQLGLFFRS